MSPLNAQAWIGRTAGSFRLLVEIGRGRSGVVFLAEHVTTNDRVAVKIFPPGPAADAVLCLAPLLQRLRHPHIVRVLEAGRADAGAYAALELVPCTQSARAAEGQTAALSLAQYLHATGSPMSEPVVVDLLLDVLAAIEYAHGRATAAHALPHGGLHPGGILLCNSDERLWARIADLGMPVAIERRKAADAYLSPEELQGSPPTMASDIHALGALGYLMLTAMAPPAPLVALSLVRQDVSPLWDTFMRRTLAYDYSRRFADYAEVRTALHDIRAASGKRKKWRTMKVALFTNALVGMLVIAAVIIVFYYRSNRPPTAVEPPLSAPGASSTVPSSPGDLPAAGMDGQEGGSVIVLDKSAPRTSPPQSPSIVPDAATLASVADATSILDTTATISLPGSLPSPEAALTTTGSVAAPVPAPATVVATIPPSSSPVVQDVVASTTSAAPAEATAQYVVRMGDTPWKIARAHNIPFATLLSINNLDKNAIIRPGQKLIVTTGGSTPVPASPTVVEALHEVVQIIDRASMIATPFPTMTVSSAHTPRTHVVAKGENYYSIARKYSCDVKALQALNTNAPLQAGLTIKLP